MSQDLSENNNVTELSNYDSANGVYAYLSEGERHIAKPIEKLLNGLTVEDASRVLIKVRRSLLSKSVVKLS